MLCHNSSIDPFKIWCNGFLPTLYKNFIKPPHSHRCLYQFGNLQLLENFLTDFNHITHSSTGHEVVHLLSFFFILSDLRVFLYQNMALANTRSSNWSLFPQMTPGDLVQFIHKIEIEILCILLNPYTYISLLIVIFLKPLGQLILWKDHCIEPDIFSSW